MMSPFLRFPSNSFQGFSFNAFIDKEILPLFTSITFALIFSPTLNRALGSSISPQSISEMCTSPSSPYSIFKKIPKSTIPATSHSSSSPREYFAITSF